MFKPLSSSKLVLPTAVFLKIFLYAMAHDEFFVCLFV